MMKRILSAIICAVFIFSLFLSGCGGLDISRETKSSSVSETEAIGVATTETEESRGSVLDFELSENLTLEFDPAEKTSPQKAYTAYATQYQYDYLTFKSVFGLDDENINVTEEDFNPAFDHYYGVDGVFSHAYNIGYSGQDRIQNGQMYYSRDLLDRDTRSSLILSSVNALPSWQRGIEPYKGEKVLDGIDLQQAKSEFERYIGAIDIGENTYIALESVYSLSEEDQAEYFVSPLNRNRLWDLETGEYLTEVPAEYLESFSNVYFFGWRQYIEGIPITYYSWGLRFTESARLATQCIRSYANAAGEIDILFEDVFCNVRLGECREVVPFSVALEKVNDIVSLSMTDTKYSVFGAELCYGGYYTDTFEVYFHPMWVIIVDEYLEETQSWDSFSRGIYAIDAFTGELIQNADIPVLG